jgi:hydroxymethylglutaryl-CoA reductase (NADPH)
MLGIQGASPVRPGANSDTLARIVAGLLQ